MVVQYHIATPLLVPCLGWNDVMAVDHGSWVMWVMGHERRPISISATHTDTSYRLNGSICWGSGVWPLRKKWRPPDEVQKQLEGDRIIFDGCTTVFCDSEHEGTQENHIAERSNSDETNKLSTRRETSSAYFISPRPWTSTFSPQICKKMHKCCKFGKKHF